MTPAQWHAEGRYFQFAGHRVFYRANMRETLNPTALVCIHGFPTASWDWSHIWDRLCDAFDIVIAPDMLGFGFSDKPALHRYSIFEQCDLHEQLLTSLGVRQAVVLAHDYGDTVAQEWLARTIDGNCDVQVQAVTFLNGGLFPETHQARRVQKLLASPIGPFVARLMRRPRFDATFREIFGTQSQPSTATLDAFWELATREGGKPAMARLIGYMKERRRYRQRWVGALVNSPVPLRVIDGVDDPVSGGHMVSRYRELVPDPDVVMLSGVGHYPQVESPEAVLEGFLSWPALSGLQAKQ